MKDITQEKEVEIYVTAIRRWGPISQIIKAIEEMGELQQALAKYLNAPEAKTLEEAEAGVRPVREEMADVSIMLNQLALIFGSADEEEARKLQRLADRLGIE